MQLEELTAYAREKYQIEEQRKWNDFPGFSVLCHPKTGKCIALLMRQWDTDTGEEIERCDIKCGLETLASFRRPYLAPPIRMHSDKWISVAFGRDTEEEIVFRLLDKAVSSGNPSGYTLVLESPAVSSADKAVQNSAAGPGTESGPGRKIYQDTPLPAAGRPGFRSGKSFPRSCGRCGTFINTAGSRPRLGRRILSGRLCSCRIMRTTCRGSAVFQAIIRPITILRPGSCAVISPGARSCGAGILNRLRLRRPIFISMNYFLNELN